MATMKDVAGGRAFLSLLFRTFSTIPVPSLRRRRLSPPRHARTRLFCERSRPGLALGRSNFLGILVSDIENPFFPGVIKSFEDLARPKWI